MCGGEHEVLIGVGSGGKVTGVVDERRINSKNAHVVRAGVIGPGLDDQVDVDGVGRSRDRVDVDAEGLVSDARGSRPVRADTSQHQVGEPHEIHLAELVLLQVELHLHLHGVCRQRDRRACPVGAVCSRFVNHHTMSDPARLDRARLLTRPPNLRVKRVVKFVRGHARTVPKRRRAGNVCESPCERGAHLEPLRG